MKFHCALSGILTIASAFVIPSEISAQRKPAPRPQATSSSLDGEWTGKTLQGQTIAFSVVKGKITSFTFGGRFAGAGCSTTSTTTSTIDKPVVNRAFSFSTFAGPGGVSVTVAGKFVNPTTVQGTAAMVLQSIPGPPPGVPGYVPGCGGHINTKWAAIKGNTPPNDVRALLDTSPGLKRAGPPSLTLVSPKAGDVLDNGCSNLEEPLEWSFSWEPAKGATRYHLYVIHETASNPVVDINNITTTSYSTTDKGMIPSQNLEGWLWKVRPMVNGVWKAWSEERRFDVESEGKDCDEWRTAIKTAAASGDEAKLNSLLSVAWANSPKSKQMKYYTLIDALGSAVTNAKLPIIRLLLDAGADANAAVSGGKSVLKASIALGNAEIVGLLLEKGASPNTDRFDDNPPLYMASAKGAAEIVKLLLKNGANPNAEGFGFKRPLIAAVKSGNLETVRALLEAKAHPSVSEFGGKTALRTAEEMGFKEVAALLKQYGAN